MADKVSLSPAAQRLLNNANAINEQIILNQMASLTPKHYDSFNSILSKYPSMSRDVVMALVSQGFDANTPGIDKISSVDGISQLKADAASATKFKSSVKKDNSLLGKVKDAFANTVYDPFKGATRLTFAALRSPYDYATTIGRDAFSAVTGGGTDAAMRLVSDLNPTNMVKGETTQFGQAMRAYGGLFSGNNVDMGSGFFLDPESKVSKAQAAAMSKYGQINGQSFTIGRGVASSVAKVLGEDPNYYGYSIMSGFIDAGLNIASDPSTWIPAGALSKVIRGGKLMREEGKLLPRKVSLKEVKDSAAEVGRLKEMFHTEAVKEATKTNKAISKIRTRYADDYLKSELELQQLNDVKAAAQLKVAQKALDAEKNLANNYSTVAGAKETLTPENISQWVITNPGMQDGSLLRAVSKISADMHNTDELFAGAMHLDEIPTAGKISIGAHGLDEYAVTYVGKKTPKLVDLTNDLSTATNKEVAKEVANRSKLMEAIRDEASNFDNTPADRTAFDALYNEYAQASAQSDGPVGSLLFGQGQYNLATMINTARTIGNPKVTQFLVDNIQAIWKADGFANIRSLFGETGGIVITNSKLLAARGVDVTSAIANIVDPTNVAPHVRKLIDGVKNIDQSIGAAELKLEDALNAKTSIEQKIKDVNLFRNYADQDPELLAQIINDPEYKGLRKIINMNIKVADKDILTEFYRTEVGLTKNFGGTLAKDFTLPLRYMLGNRFAEIAKIVAAETNPNKVRNFFGKKLDASIVKELTDAKTENDVYAVFLKYLGQEGTDPNLFRAPSLRMKAFELSGNPVAKIIDPINLKAIKLAEATEKSFGRFYVRSAVINLGDTESSIQGIENWLTSSRIDKVIGKKNFDIMMEKTVNKLFNATSEQQRGKIITDAVHESLTSVLNRLGVLDTELADEIKNVIRVSGKEKALIETFSTSRIGTNEVPTMFFGPKGAQQLTGAMHEFQLLQETLRLPDSKEVMKILNKATTNSAVYGKAKAAKVLIGELGDIWRTAQLVFRIAFIARNVGEMQMRQFFTGHSTMFNHPFQFIAMVMADPNGGKVGKLANRYSRYRFDAMGNEFKNAEAEGEFLDAVRQYNTYKNRMISANDMRGREVAKYYTVVGNDAPSYYKDLAYTINRMHTDKFDADIADMILKGAGEDVRRGYIDELIANFDKPASPLRNYVESIYDKNVGLRNVVFKNPALDNPVKADNIDANNLFTLFFDETQADSLISQIKAVAGYGSKSNHILDLIANGRTTVFDAAGKGTTVETSWLAGKIKSVDELTADEERFKTALSKALAREDVTGSQVFSVREKLIGGSDTKMLNGAVDAFFRLSAHAENKINFGPEFQMAYWDYIARYANMLETKELKAVYENAVKSLSPITINGRPLGLGQAPLKAIRKEIRKREVTKNYVHQGGVALETVNRMASEQAALHVKDLFYDAAKQRQWSNAWRLIFPFAQAQGNTMFKWAQLATQNPLPLYRFGKAYDALTKEGSGSIYDIFGMTHDSNQGFLYKDEQGNERFKYPLVGTVLGALTGQGVNAANALQLTAPVQSLNLAFGQVNPVLPGLGPAAAIAFTATGKSQAFGPGWQIARDLIIPFGQPQNAEDVLLPSWLKKSFLYAINNSTQVQRDTKDWASYLASSGKYGENPLADDASRTKLFQDAEGLARGMGLFTSLFQSIAPATPSQEVLARIKTNENKSTFMTMTMLFNAWQVISEKHPGEFNKAVTEFADTYGAENLLVTIGGSTRAVRGTQDAWNFLNNNPNTSNKAYAQGNGDVVPYFFPGGEYSIAYYNWQKAMGRRSPLTTEELSKSAENLVYNMMKSQIVEEQIAGGYNDSWYNAKIANLDAQFGGAKPSDTTTTGTVEEKINNVGKALQDPAFAQSPIYDEAKQFYEKYAKYQSLLNEVKQSNYAQLTGGSFYATLMREELVSLANELIQKKPEFGRMYYGVFAGQLKG